ncbi:MAG: ParA family protein, partial [Planctomycetota bacterium]
MRTIVITNQKGGCGKTTTAVNLAATLAQMDQRVLIVDLDPQAHATLGLGCEPDSCKRTIYHSLAHKQVALSRIIINTQIPGLDLAPSSIQLAKAEQELISVSRKEYILADQLKTVDNRYDICVIDCPPSLGLLTFNALVASTDVIVPVQVHYYALEGLKQLLETIKTARKRFYPCSVRILGILLTFVERKAALSSQVETQMRGFFGDLVFDTVIHRTISLAEAPSAGQSISTYAPDSKGSAEYKALAEEITDPDYEKQRKHPQEVSAIVDQAESDEQVDVEEPATKAEAAKRIPLIVREAPREVLRPASALRTAVKKFVFLLLLAIPIAAAVVFAVYFLNLSNTPPLAEHSNVTVREDVATPITLPASDADGDRLSYRVVEAPAHGTLSGTGPTITYTPESNYSGPDKIVFAVNDGEVDSDLATISIAVTAVDDPPGANQQSVQTKLEKSASITLTGNDIDSKDLSFAVATRPSHGKLSVGLNFAASGKLVYMPERGFTGSDSFTFKTNDGTSDSNLATVSIDVIPNRIPMAEPLKISTLEDSPKVINLQGSDPDGDTVVYCMVKSPSYGALSGTAPNFTYTPNRNFSGPDSFTFKVNDGEADSDVATVSITVRQVNDTPTAINENVTLVEDTPTTIPLRGLDPDGSPLTCKVLEGPSHGSLSGTEPNMVYSPEPNYNGPDSFTFKVNDGTADSMPATVSILVTGADDAPVATDDSVTGKEDSELAITLTGSDPDGDALSYAVLRNPAHGTLSGTAPNLIYTPNPNFSWLDSFTFRANDGTADSAPATIRISVTPVNDPPKA